MTSACAQLPPCAGLSNASCQWRLAVFGRNAGGDGGREGMRRGGKHRTTRAVFRNLYLYYSRRIWGWLCVFAGAVAVAHPWLCAGVFLCLCGKHNSACAWRGTMAPRQLKLEPVEVDSTADKGAKRVRVDSTEELFFPSSFLLILRGEKK
eukprot:scaffold32199_cov108-Isochrysis_galbana.AAC.1